ncbi:phenylacetate-CoA oxygenase subunit PaaC [Actinoplanes sp. LDG1-06]|uniref:Phenylacetate-CoA oxygenase subunit PaaC n=1 Tax=Paractinoplanes ovalisporus TaxID=2810368 RepID=A0ABS2ATB1_9ACTN|nr:1,2-phenylacetyl-CoA epoxidase subunit PaaC [Actinoplanes ovalisporus]MBM2622628.1 phenylacetate-CoA oxygenase subunit PaaC [Actinoplanes ovalisporus]
MSFDDAYQSLTDHDDDARWAYGTGFSDPLAGVPTALPDGVDGAALAAYCLMIGDDALIMSHRLQQWVTRAPELEDEMALANIGLDLLGQARLLLTRAGEAEGAGRDEDALAYLRDASDFRHVRLVERADADFAHLIARLLVFATWRLALLDRLSASRDPVLAAIGAKGVKEVAYHRDYAAGWTVRLGDGTDLSHQRMQAAVDEVWPLLGELFEPHATELALAGVAVDPSTVRAECDAVFSQVLHAATLDTPAAPPASGVSTTVSAVTGGAVLSEGAVLVPAPTGGAASGDASARLGGRGRDGVHGAELGEILEELQGLARANPGGVW